MKTVVFLMVLILVLLSSIACDPKEADSITDSPEVLNTDISEALDDIKSDNDIKAGNGLDQTGESLAFTTLNGDDDGREDYNTYNEKLTVNISSAEEMNKFFPKIKNNINYNNNLVYVLSTGYLGSTGCTKYSINDVYIINETLLAIDYSIITTGPQQTDCACLDAISSPYMVILISKTEINKYPLLGQAPKIAFIERYEVKCLTAD